MDKLIFYIDGASRGNPGKTGIGVVICDSQNNVLKKIKQYLGKTTNNVAEYMALIFALQEGLIRGASKLTIYTDSELVVKQLEGTYRVKNELLKIFFKQVEHLLEAFKEVKVKHIKREKNQEADKLANQAIDMSA